MSTYTETRACRVCGNKALDPVFNLGEQALTGVFPKSAASQAALTRGPLELVKCREGGAAAGCGLLQLRHSYAPTEMYGENYGYRSSLNRSMVEHLHGKARAIAARVPLARGDIVVDIGSNDSTLLRGYPDMGLRRIGLDPTAAKFRRFYPPEIELVTDFFSSSAYRALAGDRKAKIVTSIAMFYDLERPLDFVRQVKEILASDGVWVFEQSYMPTMLRTGSYDTICHEHIEYYALAQVRWLLDRAGLRLLDVELNDVNGGSFSVVAGQPGGTPDAHKEAVASVLAEERSLGLADLAPYAAFRDRALRHREALAAFVRGVNSRGERILGYGASTKGNVILQYCGLTARDLPCIAEVNDDKFGAFTPGTGIAIVSEAEARAQKPDYFLVLPWHFRDGIIQRERDYLRSGGKLVFPLPEIEVLAN